MTQSSSVERLVGEIDEFGYTVVEDVLDADSVAAYLADTRRLERELPTVIANSTTVVKGLARPGHVPVDRVDHDWVRIDNLLLHGTRYEALPVHPKLLPVIEGVLGRDCLLSWCMTSNQLPGAVAQRLHCDDEMYPLPRPHQPLLCNALIALCDFTADNGATQVGARFTSLARAAVAAIPGGQAGRDQCGRRVDLEWQPVAYRRSEPHRCPAAGIDHQLLRGVRAPAGQSTAVHPARVGALL